MIRDDELFRFMHQAADERYDAFPFIFAAHRAAAQPQGERMKRYDTFAVGFAAGVLLMLATQLITLAIVALLP